MANDTYSRRRTTWPGQSSLTVDVGDLLNKIEEKILDFLKERDAPVHVAQLVRMLGLGRRGKTEVRQRMKKMIREGRVLKGRGQTYRLPRESPVMEGTFSLARDGYGFVAVATGADVFVPDTNM